MKRKVHKSHYHLLEKEFHYLEKTGHLQSQQADELLAVYEPTGKINFVHTLLIIGSILIGVGVLSFIAGNWQTIPSLSKFLLLFFATAGFYIGGYKLESSYPRTARSFYYIGIFVFGASIFLIGQMFHLGGDAYSAFLLWGIGILPLAYYLKDKFIAAGVAYLFILYAFNIFDTSSQLPYALFLFIPLLYWLNSNHMEHSRGLFIANTLLSFVFLFNIFYYFQFSSWFGSLIFFGIGLFLAFSPLHRYKYVAEWLGSIVYGIAGIALTFPSVWANSYAPATNDGTMMAVIFTVLFIAMLIFLLKVGRLPAIPITCALIFRFYTDLSYDFMPKSLFFVISGLILIGFGFWFEKTRRETVKTDEKRQA